MAKKDMLEPSAQYHAHAHDAFRGMLWFAALGWFTLPLSPLFGYGLLVAAAVTMVIGCVMYVFSHQAKLLEAEDAVNALPKQTANPAP